MFKITEDRTNKYVEQGLTVERCLELADGWDDCVPPVIMQPDPNIIVWDDSQYVVPGIGMAGGTKARWADLLVSTIETDEMVYVAPRTGWAAIALCALAKKHGKKLTLFMPASKAASPHQLVAIERGASPIFVKIAAMPVLNKYAKDYADASGATFLPFGLDHPLVVAAGVKSTLKWTEHDQMPSVVVSVVSTGVLTRTLQIAWPEKQFVGVAVARNMHPGEVGRAHMRSYDQPFQKPARIKTPFNSAPTYDAKGYEVLKSVELARTVLFWNVAGDAHPQHLTPADVDSQRGWGERR